MIKVTTSEPESQIVIGFPKLMVDKHGEVILASKIDGTISGTCIYDPKQRHVLGYYSDGWISTAFSDYTGEITLKNELI